MVQSKLKFSTFEEYLSGSVSEMLLNELDD